MNNDGSGNLSGYAWGTNIGWLNFNPSHSQVTIDQSTGEFDGYAWSENVGWIHFRNASPAYGVKAIFSGGPSTVYLPLLFKNFSGTTLVATGTTTPIAGKPATTPGEIFFETTVTLPPLQPTGRYYFSGGGGPITPALLEIPRSTMSQIAGQIVTIRLRDIYGGSVSSSPIYLVYQP